MKKKGTKSVKMAKKRRKTGHPDVFRAFLLASVITIFSAVISFAIITVHSGLTNTSAAVITDDELLPVVVVEADNEKISGEQESSVSIQVPISEPTKHSNSVSIQQPVRENVNVPVPAHSTQETASNAFPRSVPPVINTPASYVQRPPERPVETTVENLGTLIFVIDDAGNNLHELEPFLRIPGPLTIAVLPGLPYSGEAARRIRAAGKEVILHQPMEAIGAQNPGPGAIYSGMSADEIRSILTRNIGEIGPVVGINNHQGSKITMDRELVETILIFCAEQGLYFLDSRTTTETVVPSLARRLGMKIAERDVFLDNEQDKNAMLRYITNGLERARRNGSAVMIGHVWSPDLAPLLAEQFPLLTTHGYTIKTASDIIKSER